MRAWIKIIAALVVLAILLVICVSVGKLLIAAVQVVLTDGGETEADPMFAEEAEMITPPPELTEEGEYVHEDVSDQWIMEYETPVDMTADELAREAQMQAEIDS